MTYSPLSYTDIYNQLNTNYSITKPTFINGNLGYPMTSSPALYITTGEATAQIESQVSSTIKDTIIDPFLITIIDTTEAAAITHFQQCRAIINATRPTGGGWWHVNSWSQYPGEKQFAYILTCEQKLFLQ